MKKLLLFITLIGSLSYGQQTFNLDWQQGINGDAASVTIAAGDTVTWTWTNGSPHNVNSNEGSTETFESQTIAQEGFTYSYTFTQVGSNDYVCTVHPGSMFGTITVTATMSLDERFTQNLKMYPTQVDSQTQLTSLYQIQDIEIYALNGVKVHESKDVSSNLVNMDLSNLSSGLHFMKIISLEGQESTIKFLKN